LQTFSAGSWCVFAGENPWILAPSTLVAIRWQEMGTFANKHDDFACRFLSNEHKKKRIRDWNGTYFNQEKSGMEWNHWILSPPEMLQGYSRKHNDTP